MRSDNIIANQLHLVLIGGGHAQITVLKSFAMRPIDGVRITLVTDVLMAPYSGMLPGYIEGLWQKDEMHIDLARLASFAGAELIHNAVTAIDADNRTVHFQDRPSLHFDMCAINSGAVPDIASLKGADEFGLPVKPIAHLLEKLPRSFQPKQIINIIGAGVAGVEIALAIHKKFEAQAPEIHIFSRSDTILSKMPKRAGRLIETLCHERGIRMHHNAEVIELTKTKIKTASGGAFASGLNLIVTGVKPADFVKSLNRSLTANGFISVKNTLQTTSHPYVFACGDVASIEGAAREKAGVFAVRAGPVMAENIRRLIHGQTLKQWTPQTNYLAIIGTADGRAIAVRNKMVSYGKIWFQLKNYIDKKFMNKFNVLPEMKINAPKPLAYYEQAGLKQDDAIFKDMRCAGCAAKASASTLQSAMIAARDFALAQGANPAFLPAEGIYEDAGLTPALNKPLRHSFDSLNQMIADPFIFAQIAVNHALSDLYVSGAAPLYAQAHLNLKEASEAQQLDSATQLLAGSLKALADAKTKLIGGHSSQSLETSLGFAVTGAQSHQLADYDEATDYVIVMTKKLGIGIGLAAYMRQQASASLYHTLIQHMLISNKTASLEAFRLGAIGITDITGFGLARHLMNLIATLPVKGCAISLQTLAYFEDSEALIARGISSSSFLQNQRANPDIHYTPSAADDWRQNLLFDPQTSGGICAIIPKSAAVEFISNPECPSPRIIGEIRPHANGLFIEP